MPRRSLEWLPCNNLMWCDASPKLEKKIEKSAAGLPPPILKQAHRDTQTSGKNTSPATAGQPLLCCSWAPAPPPPPSSLPSMLCKSSEAKTAPGFALMLSRGALCHGRVFALCAEDDCAGGMPVGQVLRKDLGRHHGGEGRPPGAVLGQMSQNSIPPNLPSPAQAPKAACRSQRAPRTHVRVCMCSNVWQFKHWATRHWDASTTGAETRHLQRMSF